MKKLISWALQFRITRSILVYVGSRGPMLADSITYRALFSLFAGVLLGFSVVILWLDGNPHVIAALADSLQSVVPGVKDLIDFETMHAPIGFTLTGIGSLVGLILAAIGATNSFRVSLQVLADQPDEGSPIGSYLRDLGVAAGLGILLGFASLGTFATSIGLGTISSWLGVSDDSSLINLMGRLFGVLIVFGFDTVAIAFAFRLLSGTHASRQEVWKGAAIGGVGLVILQNFSGLFVQGASSNPLLASFAALIALLLWFNLSAQVILLASCWIIVGVQEGGTDRRVWRQVHTVEQWRLMRAQQRAASAEDHLEKTEQKT